MKITNVMGLPHQFEQIAQDHYKYKDKQYSVTTILSPMREIMLKRRHGDEITQDCSDMLWALFGSGLHAMMEQYKEKEDELTEEYLIVDLPNGYKLSGRFDLYSASLKQITDYKTTSTWSVIYKSSYEDWRKQLLIYAWMLRKTGFECNNGQIIALMRDWQKSKAKYDSSYPQQQVEVIKFDFSEQDFIDIEKWIYEKFKEIEECEKLSDEELPQCSAEDRWEDPTQYAVKKKGNKRALKLYTDLKEAEIHVMQNPEELELEIREGLPKKCMDYCTCNEYCSYYKKYINL